MAGAEAYAYVDTDSCLRLENVGKRFGKLQAVEEVSLVVQPGERRAIIGPNGAGKTTLFNLVAGELKVTTGQVHFFGREITHMPVNQRAALGIGRTFQATTLFPRLSAADNVVLALQALTPQRRQLLWPRKWGGKLEHQALVLLREIGLGEKADVQIQYLSYGEQRQIEIMLALVQRPKLLLLDEPTAGLSPGDVPLVTNMLKNLSRDVTMVLIEHDMGVVFELVDRITVLNYGRVVAEGTPEEIRANALVQEIYLGGTL